jgi:protein-tyrosine phosphatase
VIPDSYWAVPEKLLAGPLPTGKDRESERAAIRTLLDAGIRCVIDLRTPVEAPGVRVLLEKLSDDAVWIGFPILDGDAPTPPRMQAILDAIDASIARDRPVYVHCQGGRGRTGTVVACHWIRHGLFDNDAALAELMVRRRGLLNGERPSPETGVQHRLVKSWTRAM